MGKFLLIFLILASANAFAEVNKWVDDQGRVHYSDQAPPPEVQAKALRSAAEGAASGVAGTNTPAASESFVEQEAALKKEQRAKQAADEQAARKQAAADALKANCENARQSLRSLQSDGRIMDTNASGERYFIDDAERQQRIEKAQQDIGNLCK